MTYFTDKTFSSQAELFDYIESNEYSNNEDNQLSFAINIREWDPANKVFKVYIYNNKNYMIDTNNPAYSNTQAIPLMSDFNKWVSSSGFIDQMTWIAGQAAKSLNYNGDI